MITEIEDFFTHGCGRCDRFATPDCSTRQWASGLAGLRRICLAAELQETVKWGHPCYMHAGRNVAIIGAFRGDFRLTFFDAALLKDPGRVLEKQGPNTRHADCLRFTDNAGPAHMESTIAAYLAEAMANAAAGLRPPKADEDLELPDELVTALDADPDLAEAFHALTPGRQKSYVILLSGAKTSATRFARIEKARPRILAGKGAMER
ncbi:hypothetical protein EI545_01535 [Tabrizicola piscis]|uniref:YdhG-like domain-containing protein n=1 Tax=Tabrizicola piscis TaxID=2494374 RepID=A0A3S8U210_9RHOB|nr:YdeI/OmpD-associated family protein [Tabrizicola piscis]AZL57640.1 hypothetical protein EI545_01535 [Tabrizicola piscis]